MNFSKNKNQFININQQFQVVKFRDNGERKNRNRKKITQRIQTKTSTVKNET